MSLYLFFPLVSLHFFLSSTFKTSLYLFLPHLNPYQTIYFVLSCFLPTYLHSLLPSLLFLPYLFYLPPFLLLPHTHSLPLALLFPHLYSLALLSFLLLPLYLHSLPPGLLLPFYLDSFSYLIHPPPSSFSFPPLLILIFFSIASLPITPVSY
ncbi:unnamed protein product [Acanthosepion pharaonis]|uniref:Uncharacterized protein n=1 Tax=Acanthosepion pharaonis TaxID=158019 RepID=A0A812AR76_ACAPH|nr:unnamed protein product [Sepia pharaonis]